MNHTEFQIAAGAALFATFLIGWLAGWLVQRAGRDAAAPVAAGPAPPVPEPADAETQARLTAARAELREAHVEIEELRAYIDRKLAARPEAE